MELVESIHTKNVCIYACMLGVRVCVCVRVGEDVRMMQGFVVSVLVFILAFHVCGRW